MGSTNAVNCVGDNELGIKPVTCTMRVRGITDRVQRKRRAREVALSAPDGLLKGLGSAMGSYLIFDIETVDPAAVAMSHVANALQIGELLGCVRHRRYHFC